MLKGDSYECIRISSQAQNRWGRKNQCEAFIRIIRCKLFLVPLSNYPNPRDLQILKTSSLKCATYLAKDIPVGMEKKVELVLDVAKNLEKYLTVTPNQEQSSLPGESPELRSGVRVPLTNRLVQEKS